MDHTPAATPQRLRGNNPCKKTLYRRALLGDKSQNPMESECFQKDHRWDLGKAIKFAEIRHS